MFPGSMIVDRALYLLGFIIMMIINLKTHKRYNLNKTKTIILTLITYVAGVSGAMIMGDIFNALMASKGYPGNSAVAIFGAVIFTPIIMTIAALIFKQSWRGVLDMLAPGIFIILACAKLGCFLDGCCHGVECSFGIKYLNNDMTVFPIQIVEVIFMSLIIAFCFWFAFKSKYYVKGTIYPVTTIVYCFMRFFIEFFRYYELEEQRHIILGMTFWQFCCILSTIVCIVWIVVLNSKKVKALDAIVLEKQAEIDLAEAKKAKKKAEFERAKKAKEKNRKRK